MQKFWILNFFFFLKIVNTFEKYCIQGGGEGLKTQMFHLVTTTSREAITTSYQVTQH